MLELVWFEYILQTNQGRLQKTKKLRDVLQEREGTSLNYFKVFFNYIKQFSWSLLSILCYLG